MYVYDETTTQKDVSKCDICYVPFSCRVVKV